MEISVEFSISIVVGLSVSRVESHLVETRKPRNISLNVCEVSYSSHLVIEWDSH